MTDLAAHERVRTPTTTVAIRRLEKIGLVKRSRDPSDLRAVLVDITPRGRAVHGESLANRRAALAAMLSQLPASDLEHPDCKALAPLERLASGEPTSGPAGEPPARKRHESTCHSMRLATPVELQYMPTALITGASGGIGSAIATALAPPTPCCWPVGPLTGSTPSRRGSAHDVSAGPDRHGEIEAACEIVDELDVLVHNAGVSIPGHVAESNVDEWRATFAVNVLGPVELTLALLPALRRAHGQVVFINSGAGRNVSPGMASYSASKFALRAFADSLRADEPELRVTTVYPGRTDTEMQRELVAFEGGMYDPAKFLRPETVAAAVANVVATPPDGHVHEVILRPRAGDDRVADDR